MADESKHTYPSKYPPGSGGWELDKAWEILDSLEPGVLDANQRAWLAGLITAALENGHDDRQ